MTSRAVPRASSISPPIQTRDFVLAADGHPEQIRGQQITASFPALVGLDSTLAPLVGRSFAPADFEPGQPAVALISHRLWTRRFASDRAIVGRAIKLDAAATTIIGVLPAAFDLFPDSEILEPMPPTFGGGPGGPGGPGGAGGNDRLYRYLEVLGRLSPDTTLARAEATLTALMSRGQDSPPVRLSFVRELLVKNVRRVLLTMWVMTGLWYWPSHVSTSRTSSPRVRLRVSRNWPSAYRSAAVVCGSPGSS